MKRLSTHSQEKKANQRWIKYLPKKKTKNNSKQREQLMLLVSAETVKACVGFIESVYTRNLCLVPFGLWDCTFLQWCRLSASKVTRVVKGRGGWPLQTASTFALTAFETKVTNMEKRWFWGWLGRRRGHVQRGPASLQFLKMCRRLKLLSWDGKGYWKVEGRASFDGCGMAKEMQLLSHHLCLLNGGGWWAVGKGAEQSPWVSGSRRESALLFNSDGHLQEPSFLPPSVELCYPLVLYEMRRSKLLLWAHCQSSAGLQPEVCPQN